MKTLVGVPCSESIKSRTAFSLFNLKGNIELAFQIGSDVAHNRNLLAMRSIEGKFSHLLLIDSDMTFEPDTLRQMLAQNKDIVGLAANHRRLPLQSVVKPLDGDVSKPLPTQLFEAASCGTGVMLIRTSVFENILVPWFEFEYVDGERIGEDVNFCRKAREAGFKICVDPTIPVRHVGEYLY